MTADRGKTTCPTCGAEADRGQLVCLECGSRIALDYRRPPTWKVPLAIGAVVGVVLLVAAVAAWREVNDKTDAEVATTPIQVKEKAAAKTEKKQTAKKETTKTATTPAATTPTGGEAIVEADGYYTWPKDLSGFTVVLVSNEDEESAKTFARSANKGDVKAGVIRSNDFGTLPKDFFLVFAGQYETMAEAEKAASALGKQYQGAFPQKVAP
jgi:septal ring-binding cell division protein DamX